MGCFLNSFSAAYVKPKTVRRPDPCSAASNPPGGSHLKKEDIIQSKSCHMKVGVGSMMHTEGAGEEQVVPVSNYPVDSCFPGKSSSYQTGKLSGWTVMSWLLRVRSLGCKWRSLQGTSKQVGCSCSVMLLGSNVEVLSDFCFRDQKRRQCTLSQKCFNVCYFLLDVLFFSFSVMAIGTSVSNCPWVAAHPKLNLWPHVRGWKWKPQVFPTHFRMLLGLWACFCILLLCKRECKV